MVKGLKSFTVLEKIVTIYFMHRSKKVTKRKLFSKRRFISPIIYVLVGVISLQLVSIAAATLLPPRPPEESPAPNPALTSQACLNGINIALLADTSNSLTNNVPAFNQMKTALHDFVSSLLPGTQTKFSVSRFGSSATVKQGLTNSTPPLFSAISGLGANNGSDPGGTNWEAGLQVAGGTLAGTPANTAKLLIIATDGDPTVPFYALQLAINAANLVKSGNVHILALGMGPSPTLNNLKAISGPNVNTGGINADVVTTNFANMGQALQNIARSTCTAGGGNGGTGGGNGGTGDGRGGLGRGIGGAGDGSSGAGSGSSGAGSGSSSGSGGGSSGGASPTKPTAQGTQPKPPERKPSPFFDGQEFARGSTADNLISNISRMPYGWVYIAIAVTVLLLGAGGAFLLWRKRSRHKSDRPRQGRRPGTRAR